MDKTASMTEEMLKLAGELTASNNFKRMVKDAVERWVERQANAENQILR